MSEERPEAPADDERPAALASEGERPREEVKDGVLRIYPPEGGEHAAVLAESSRAFARGDFGGARRLARRARAGNPTPPERIFAEEILKRTAHDPVAILVGLGSFALFWVVIALTSR